ncbi:MAG: nucleotidyltransferase family protein [Devosia nanyangense]|uniref:Nucleotidyltransferase family protein n=1 Tax=Devosia nanyangense TaxID=1228055 RepID=A0A933P084_9HYPH|nr:nucleotidyltransferase family protein [Devosia nanyangense]
MAGHLRYSGLDDAAQRAALIEIIGSEPLLMEVLRGLRDTALPDWLLVAGAIYNVVWNRLTDRPALTGVKDIDVFYFDDSDLSYEAEDAVIKRLGRQFAHLPLPVEPRNQARVHLWFPQKFNQPFAPLASSSEMLGRYASKTHSVAARLEADDTLSIVAPFGLDDIFSFRIVPNHLLENEPAHTAKAARAKSVWPELSVEPW